MILKQEIKAFKILKMCFFIILLFLISCTKKEEELKILVLKQNTESSKFYAEESQRYEFSAQSRIDDYTVVRENIGNEFDSIKQIKNLLKIYFEKCDYLRQCEKLTRKENQRLIIKSREEIQKLTHRKTHFVNLKELDCYDDEIFESCVKNDFLKIYYILVRDLTTELYSVVMDFYRASPN